MERRQQQQQQKRRRGLRRLRLRRQEGVWMLLLQLLLQLFSFYFLCCATVVVVVAFSPGAYSSSSIQLPDSRRSTSSSSRTTTRASPSLLLSSSSSRIRITRRRRMRRSILPFKNDYYHRRPMMMMMNKNKSSCLVATASATTTTMSRNNKTPRRTRTMFSSSSSSFCSSSLFCFRSSLSSFSSKSSSVISSSTRTTTTTTRRTTATTTRRRIGGILSNTITTPTTTTTTRSTTMSSLWMSSSSSSSNTTTTTSAAITTTTQQEETPTTSTEEEEEDKSAVSAVSHPRRVKTIHATEPTPDGESILIQGWVRTIRKQKKLAFIEVNDGSTLKGIQCVVTLIQQEEEEEEDDSRIRQSYNDMKNELDKVTTGCSVSIIGPIVQSGGGSNKQQNLEVIVESIEVLGLCPPSTYPLAKKRHTLEYLRTIGHLRSRTNTISAISRIRSQLAMSIHEYYQKICGFIYVQTPLITTSDCEGGGELFRVTTFDLDHPDTIPTMKQKEQKEQSHDNKKNNKKKKDDDQAEDNNEDETTITSSSKKQENSNITTTDYGYDFFGKAAYLTVSGQLNGETYACGGLGDIYTFGPTFRAENSDSTRHLAEFHMIEPEISFCDLIQLMNNAENMIKYTIRSILTQCNEDITFFDKFYNDNKLIQRLENLISKPFVRITYRQAIKDLQDEIAKDPTKWQFPNVTFGTDLATEHERWLCETKYNGMATFVYNYPASIKAFYMRDNDEDNGETVLAMDLLVPGVGELIGGSQREERLDKLINKINHANLNIDDYWWYIDLRKYGTVIHSGYGVGFERLVQYCTGIDNIREAIAYPRYPKNADF